MCECIMYIFLSVRGGRRQSGREHLGAEFLKLSQRHRTPQPWQQCVRGAGTQSRFPGTPHAARSAESSARMGTVVGTLDHNVAL